MNHVLISCLIFFLGLITATLIFRTELKLWKDSSRKMLLFYRVLVRWVRLKQNNISLANFFVDRGIKTVAIYGVKELGQLLIKELEDSQITVKYVIDKNADHIFFDMELHKPDDALEPVDMIVVTVLTNNTELLSLLNKKMNCPVVTIKDVTDSFSVEWVY